MTLVAADTSVLTAYLAGERGADMDVLDRYLAEEDVRLPPVVMTELLSGPHTFEVVESVFAGAKLLSIEDGYWQRAGAVRKSILIRGLKAKLADALIAQACIDHGIPLLTRDTDFRHYAKHCGLKLA